ncbi:MAG: DUF6445 family protein [Burkholderiales bacterium]
MKNNLLVFNPQPTIEEIFFSPGQSCLVIDNAVLNPDGLVRFAAEHFKDFQPPTVYAYPGMELLGSSEISAALNDFFLTHIRHSFQGRRTVSMYSRLSLMTLQPSELKPSQWICHRDRYINEPHLSIAASVLYLFLDPAFGGTSFYRPKKPSREIERLINDSTSLSAEAFKQKYSLKADYMTASNDYFELIGQVEAKWNRIIFYDGSIFHSSSFCAPEKIKADPLSGRLTFNGFFTCRKNAS